MANKLELTWYGKENQVNVEPRILIEDKTLSNVVNGDTENMLIHGDNLLALKALEKDYAGKIKCIYIDPPYNTGSAFEHYDDNLEHSTWLSLMRERLIILRKLLQSSGSIAIQIDFEEMPYLKVLCDEIFGRRNFINIVTVKTKIAGVSGSNLGKSLQDNSEYILIFAKDIENFLLNYIPKKHEELLAYINRYKEEGKSWKYTSVLSKTDDGKFLKRFYAGNGDPIDLYLHEDFEIKSINQIAKEQFNGDLSKAYYENIDKVFRTTNAQTSIRTKVIEETKEFSPIGKLFSIKYTPIKGKNGGKTIRNYYKDNNLIAWLSDVVVKDNGKITKIDTMGNIWDDIQYNNLTKEGNVQFPNGKKPETLIKRIIEMLSSEDDFVLDSFLGSGTTAAVAHKLNRKWIGIEMGEQAYTHCKVRLDRIINNEDKGGITIDSNWQGGGGYRFYELAPTLINEDSFGQKVISTDYNSDMLAAAIALHEGYKYEPDSSCYWKQSHSENNSYLFVTTNHISRDIIDSIKTELKDDEFLLISCKSFDTNAVIGVKNISIKKIPQSLLTNCEFGVDNYSLNIVSPPVYEEEEDDE